LKNYDAIRPVYIYVLMSGHVRQNVQSMSDGPSMIKMVYKVL